MDDRMSCNAPLISPVRSRKYTVASLIPAWVGGLEMDSSVFQVELSAQAWSWSTLKGGRPS